jgi:outer membrane murein-binding lipoprotein Lpp
MLLKHRNKKFVGVVVGLILLTGCQNVEPWERDRLAEPAMQLISDVAERERDQQIFFSKEAASGGTGAAGGGCGCN